MFEDCILSYIEYETLLYENAAQEFYEFIKDNEDMVVNKLSHLIKSIIHKLIEDYESWRLVSFISYFRDSCGTRILREMDKEDVEKVVKKVGFESFFISYLLMWLVIKCPLESEKTTESSNES